MMCQEKGCVVKQYVPRVLLSLLFVIGGFGFLLNFKSMIDYVETGLGNIGLPMSIATVALVIAIILKLGGGLMLMFNYRRSQAAWMLIAFTALSTIMYHTSWSGDDSQMQMTSFLKNLAIIGGLIMFAHCPCKQCLQRCKKDGVSAKSCCKEESKKTTESCCQSGLCKEPKP
ncbi:MAG: DoxX family protein [Candidatus Moranbacteria bacterium]|nr:DoxX family protein [Candidatus Moranbacteria bacterium]MBP9801894.1 DoxX family protein [Candidatus Moranbacteria bacterium]